MRLLPSAFPVREHGRIVARSRLRRCYSVLAVLSVSATCPSSGPHRQWRDCVCRLWRRVLNELLSATVAPTIVVRWPAADEELRPCVQEVMSEEADQASPSSARGRPMPECHAQRRR